MKAVVRTEEARDVRREAEAKRKSIEAVEVKKKESVEVTEAESKGAIEASNE